MLIGIVKNETNKEDYYIELNRNHNINELSVTHVSNRGIESLPKDKAINLLKTLLSSELNYQGKENEYDIYLDEANNKRYFKEGRENYFMFLENNGVDIIGYSEEGNKNNNFKKQKMQKIIVGGLVFSVIISSTGLMGCAQKTEYKEKNSFELVKIDEITSENMYNLIMSSPNLDDDEKSYIANQTYFQFVLDHCEGITHQYHLRTSFDGIKIEDYDNTVEGADIFGYYNPADINTIHMKKAMKDSMDYKKILRHEFIHMTQCPNRYRYIQEGSTEIIRQEFYDNQYYGYMDMVFRIKVLMEIIGPQPVIDCNYQSNPKSFEDAIKKYLNEEDANKLLDLFTTTAQSLYKSAENNKNINDQIDELLAKMYQNKTGKDIKDDKLINELYSCISLFLKSSVFNRTYFNPNSQYYNMETIIKEDQKLDIHKDLEEVLKQDNIVSFEYTVYETKTISGKKYTMSTKKKTNDFLSIPRKNLIDLKIIFNDDTWYHAYYNNNTEKFENIEFYRKVLIHIPSVPEEFPDQALKPVIINRNIETEKKEAKSI